MRILTELSEHPKRLGILPGSFNPPTLAHFGLAESALQHVDHVLLVLPESLPHKTWEGASCHNRIEMLRIATAPHTQIGAAVSAGGLFIEMVREARVHFPQTELFLICGRDAAERIVGWDYGYEGAIEQMLAEFRLLVAPRHGAYIPPEHLAHAVAALDTRCWDEFSSTQVRESIGRDKGWEQLIPEQLRAEVLRIYK